MIQDAGLAPLAVSGLVLFVLVFVAACIWALSRSRRTIDTWASLPLADGHEPVQPRRQPPDRSPGVSEGERTGD